MDIRDSRDSTILCSLCFVLNLIKPVLWIFFRAFMVASVLVDITSRTDSVDAKLSNIYLRTGVQILKCI